MPFISWLSSTYLFQTSSPFLCELSFSSRLLPEALNTPESDDPLPPGAPVPSGMP